MSNDRRKPEPNNPNIPWSEADEQGVLGCLLLGTQEQLDLALDRLGPDPAVFYDGRHACVFDAIQRVANSGAPVNPVTVSQALKATNDFDAIGGYSFLTALQDAVPSAANLGYYLPVVAEKARLRRLIAGLTDITSQAREPNADASSLLARAESFLLRQDAQGIQVVQAADAVQQFEADIEQRIQLQGKLTGIGTGFSDLDRLTDGLQRGEMALIGARPSVGKTALAVNITRNACLRDRVPTLFITCEMRVAALLRRLAACETLLPINSMRSGVLPPDGEALLARFNALVNAAPIRWINGVKGIDIGRLCASARRCIRRYGVQLIILDYLQKVHPSVRNEKRTYEIANVSEQLKALAESENVAVLALAQLNRESEKDKGRTPRLSDLADSGQLEKDADLVILIHRDKEEPGRAYFIVAKQRDGAVGTIETTYRGDINRFFLRVRTSDDSNSQPKQANLTTPDEPPPSNDP